MITVNEIMTVDPRTVAPNAPLRAVVSLLYEEGCRQIPVVEGTQLVGIVTDRDVRLLLEAPPGLGDLRHSPGIERLTARDAMSQEPLTVGPDLPIFRAAEMLSLYKIGALPVVDGELLVGIVTVTDLLDYLAAEGARAELEG